MAFRWRAFDGPLIVVLGSSLPSSTKKNVVKVGPPPQGGTLIFIRIRRLGPSIYRSPKKYQEFQAPKKDIWNFSNPPKKYPNLEP